MKIICDWENCKEPGSYKAPLEKDNSKKYRLLLKLKFSTKIGIILKYERPKMNFF